MSENIRIAKNSLILYVRLIVVLFIGVLSSRFILQALGASDFGLYNVVGGIVAMMAVLNNVMVSTTYRFIAIELGTGDEAGVNRIYNISLVIHIFMALMVLLVAETIGIYYIHHYLTISPGKLDDALFVFRFSVLSTVLSILSVPCQGLIFAKEKFAITASIEIFRNCLALGSIILVLYYTGNRLRLYAVLIALISILPSLFYFLYAKVKFPTLIKWNFQKLNAKYRGMVSFSGWLMFGAAAGVGEMQGSVLMINLFFGTIMNASYGIANQVNNMVKLFSQSLNQAAVPQININYGAGNKERTLNLVIFSSKYAFFLILLPSIPILLETPYILKLWLKEVPQFTSVFVRIMILNALILTMNSGIYAIVHATGKIKYFQIICSIITLLGLPVSYLFFKLGFPVYVLLIVYTVVYIINFFTYQILLKRAINFDIRVFYNKAIFKMILVSLVIIPLFLLTLVFSPGTERFIIVTLLSVASLLTMVYFFGMEEKEKEIAGDFVRKYVGRYFPKTAG